MWCLRADTGAHHSCWLLLQALFMIARALTARSTTAAMTIAKGVFIVTSLLRVLSAKFWTFKMNLG